MIRIDSRRIAPSSIESVNDKILMLSLWLDENPDINGCKDPNNLMVFLHSCKYDLERAMKKIRAYYQMRAERTEWFANRDPFLPEIQELLNIGVFLPVDGVDDKNRKIVIIRTSVHDPKVHSQNNVFKVSKMVLDFLLKLEPENCANGIVAIFDMTNVQIGHALQLNPPLIKRAVDSWQAYPCQPKLLEFINAPRYVNVVLNTFRMFMTPKMRSRVYVRKHCSVKSPCLPKDIGGGGDCYTDLAIKWKRLLEANVNFYTDIDKYKSVLKK